jgi:hypothetical protein
MYIVPIKMLKFTNCLLSRDNGSIVRNDYSTDQTETWPLGTGKKIRTVIIINY